MTTHFTHAITRRPSTSVVNGLRAHDTGTPDPSQFAGDHADYVAALESTGAQVVVLDPLEEFPDSVFVEDAALCLPPGAIVMRPGATSRRGEAAAMKPVLERFYDRVGEIHGDTTSGFVEGGDILVTGHEILVGTSARTDASGVAELREIVVPWGHTVRQVDTPTEVLHFKTDCSLLDPSTILSTRRLSSSGCFDDYQVIHVADGEEACANTIRFNDLVVIPAGFPRTEAILTAAGYTVRAVANTEAAKIDGGMSCLSLRFTPTRVT